MAVCLEAVGEAIWMPLKKGLTDIDDLFGVQCHAKYSANPTNSSFADQLDCVRAQHSGCVVGVCGVFVVLL
jgi:hypothetical protein